MAPTVWSAETAWSLQLDVAPYDVLTVVDAGDAPVVPARFERALRVIHEKVFRVAGAGPIPIVLGGDHAITYPSAAAVARALWPRRLGIVHFDAHADTGSDMGRPLRPRHADAPADRGGLGGREELRPGRPARLLAGAETFAWMGEQGMRWHRWWRSRSGEPRR